MDLNANNEQDDIAFPLASSFPRSFDRPETSSEANSSAARIMKGKFLSVSPLVLRRKDENLVRKLGKFNKKCTDG